MAESPPLPDAVVEEFSSYTPSKQDIRDVNDLIEEAVGDSKAGFPIPFNLPEFRDCYVLWTKRRKWRLVFHRKNPEGIDVLSIARET